MFLLSSLDEHSNSDDKLLAIYKTTPILTQQWWHDFEASVCVCKRERAKGKIRIRWMNNTFDCLVRHTHSSSIEWEHVGGYTRKKEENKTNTIYLFIEWILQWIGIANNKARKAKEPRLKLNKIKREREKKCKHCCWRRNSNDI